MPLHPVLERMLKRAYLRGHLELHTKSAEEVRAYHKRYNDKDIDTRHLNFDDIEVVEGVWVRLHKPKKITKPLPVIIMLRASGYVFGSMDEINLLSQYLCKRLNCIVAVLEPRLSPEFKFPIPFNDCLLGIDYLYQHRNQLNIDFKKFVLWGESSGGNLAAALSHHYKDEHIIKSQILFYPLLDYYNEYPSEREFRNGYLMDKEVTDWIIAQYTQSPADCADIRLSTLLADNYKNLPTTFIISPQYDPMRDEAMHYLQRLHQDKVTCFGTLYPGMIHGFLTYSKLEAAKDALRFGMEFVKEQFSS